MVQREDRLDLLDNDISASRSQFTMLVNAGHLGFARRVATYATEELSTNGKFEFRHEPLDYDTNYVFVISTSSSKRLSFDKRHIQCNLPLVLAYHKKPAPKLASHFGVVYLPHKSTATFVAGIELFLIRIAKSWGGFDRVLVQQGLSLTMGVPFGSLPASADSDQEPDIQNSWWQEMVFMLNVPFFDGSVDSGMGIMFDNVHKDGDYGVGKPKFVFGIGFDVDVLGYLIKKIGNPQLTHEP